MDQRRTSFHRTGLDPSRRSLLRLGAAAPLTLPAAGLVTTGVAAEPAPGTTRADDVLARGIAGSTDDAVHRLERAYDTTIGLAAANLATGARLVHRAGDRFPILSVFKTLAVAAVLRDHDLHGETLRRRVWFPPADVLEYAPVASEHVDTGMTIEQMCAAVLHLSDNTAGNLLLREVGGPQGQTAFVRSLGDRTTRLDRWEVALNTAIPGDVRDTTSPAAIARTFARLLTGTALHRHDRARLRQWMLENRTGDARLRAGLPDGWRVADRTGTGAYGTANDVGVAWNPAGEPVVIAALTRRDDQDATADETVLADVAGLVAERIG
ncbi:beta-lactamase class A [Haloactinopolyspora alba]|uniref:Beta-lactamase n=1 Tax=Haloactinopolyspora alba TaxID=648780 RepID=A0A2P8DE99_9ACTN|nr:class A beta-lactamase [Haloactinopolyspora alba]PSK95553.1 beta-lactamase class A [Haloactinopolyspora alba]